MRPLKVWNDLRNLYGIENEIIKCRNELADLRDFLFVSNYLQMDMKRLIVKLANVRRMVEELAYYFNIEEEVEAEMEDNYTRSAKAIKNIKEGKV